MYEGAAEGDIIQTATQRGSTMIKNLHFVAASKEFCNMFSGRVNYLNQLNTVQNIFRLNI